MSDTPTSCCSTDLCPPWQPPASSILHWALRSVSYWFYPFFFSICLCGPDLSTLAKKIKLETMAGYGSSHHLVKSNGENGDNPELGEFWVLTNTVKIHMYVWWESQKDHMPSCKLKHTHTPTILECSDRQLSLIIWDTNATKSCNWDLKSSIWYHFKVVVTTHTHTVTTAHNHSATHRLVGKRGITWALTTTKAISGYIHIKCACTFYVDVTCTHRCAEWDNEQPFLNLTRSSGRCSTSVCLQSCLFGWSQEKNWLLMSSNEAWEGTMGGASSRELQKQGGSQRSTTFQLAAAGVELQ